MDMMSWGVGQVIAKRATDRLGPVRIVLLVSLVDGTAYAAIWAFFAGPMGAAWTTYVVASLAAVVGMAGYILYFEALLRGNVAVVGTISGGSPVVTILGAILFLGEMPTPTQAVGIVLLLSMIVILSYEPMGKEWRIPVAVVLSIGILLLWGVWGLLTKVAVSSPGFDAFDIFLFYTLANVTMGPLYYLMRRRRAPGPADPSRAAYAIASAATLLLVVGIVATTIAFSVGDASLVAAVSGSYPVVTAIVAFTFLKEEATRQRLLAIALFVPGIVLVAF